MELAGNLAVVTGSASGIGRSVSQSLLELGASVVGLDREVATDRVVRVEHDFTELCVDVSDERVVDAASRRIRAEHGRCSILVNCAGVLRPGRVADTSANDWDVVLSVNLRGAWLVSRAFLPDLTRGGGVVVMVASGTGVRPLPGLAAYAASKAGLISLSRSIALEYAEDGVRSVCICPGRTDTPMGRQSTGVSDPVAAHDVLVPVEEVAELIVFSCMPFLRHLNGAIIALDGGRTLH